MALKDTARENADIASAEVAFAPPKVDLAKIDTLHELLALAIGDFEKVLADKRYVISMGEWHEPLDNGKCAVCLAGSVLAKSLRLPIREDYCERATGGITAQLDALDALRGGGVEAAWRILRDVWHGATPLAIVQLDDKWAYTIGQEERHATNRRAGRKLLTHLKRLQRDLADAGV